MLSITQVWPTHYQLVQLLMTRVNEVSELDRDVKISPVLKDLWRFLETAL